jgi:arabinofuranan 3-O-arabinosyltransferase
VELGVLAALAYVPVLLSSPGRVSADSKQALLVDPGTFLAGAGSLWDPSTGAGTVPHQHLGYLWPMGPWFWLFDAVGVPTWVAQRLWLGTLVLLAALGARWFLRGVGVAAAPALVGAMVFALSPYQLAFTARMSVILLPWVGLPWLVELARRAVRCGGWRHPALFALVLVTAAGVNATSLVLAGVGPALLLLWFAVTGAGRSALLATARLAVLSVGVSAWWIAGLRVQGAFGMPVLQLTENLTDVARWSSPGDVLRGLGNWFFAGRDRLGYSVDQAPNYLDSRRWIALTLALPGLALASLVLLRGRLRLLAAAWVVTGTVVAVGAWPIEGPSTYGRLFRRLTEDTTVGLALRNSHRVVPVVLLGMALAIAVLLERLPRSRWRTAATAGAGLAALGMLAPALPTGLLSDGVDRPAAIPEHWATTAELLDARGLDPTGNPRRVLEIPGSPFAAYRWGNTVEPVLPALMDRPQVAREVLPYGSAATANLLDAIDRRIQEGVFEPDSLAPIARLFASSDVVVRNDLQWERFRGPEPQALWAALTDPLPVGVSGVDRIGDPVPGPVDPSLAPVDERRLAGVGLGGEQPPAVGVLQVDQAAPILRTAPDRWPLVIAGDGDGIVDLAAAGLIDGTGLIHYADALDDDALAHALGHDAWLVVTDTNRRRIQTWFYAIRDVRGPTERAGETLLEPSRYDQRLDLFPGSTDRSRTVTEHLGGQVSASLTGGAARPEDRAMAAFDGDLATAWRIGGADPTGHRISVWFDEPIAPREMILVQPQDGPRDRHVDAIRIYLDDAEPIVVELDARSLDASGQRIDLPGAPVAHLSLEIAAVSAPPFDPIFANAVGFAEVRIPGVELVETVVLPPSLLERVGPTSITHGLDVVMTRLRHDPYERGRTDGERHLDRTVDMPVTRTFGMSGRARVSPDASDQVLDHLLGTGLAGRSASASSRLAGDLGSRAWSALDGDPATAWRPAFGPQEGAWIQVELDTPARVGTVSTTWADDEQHSVPRRLIVEVDGEFVAEVEVDVRPTADDTRVVDLPVNRDGVNTLRLVVADVTARHAPPHDPAPFTTLPVALHDLDLGDEHGTGRPAPPEPARGIDTGCRDDLLSVDGVPVPVRASGPIDSVRSGLDIEACLDVTLGSGRQRLVSEPGWRTGIDIDRLVLSSAPGGEPSAPAVRDSVDGWPAARATITRVEIGRTRWRASIDTDGAPFWLVMAQSHNAGWLASVDGVTVGEPTLVGGFANGWRVDPVAPGRLEVEVSWTPQRTVSWGIGLSALAVGVCIGLAVGTSRREVPTELHASDLLPLERPRFVIEPVSILTVVATGVVVAVAVSLVSRPWVGVLAGAATVGIAAVPGSTWLAAVASSSSLAVAVLLDRPEWAWLAVALVVAAVAGHSVGPASGTLSPRDEPRPATRVSPGPRPSGRGTDRRGRGPGS